MILSIVIITMFVVMEFIAWFMHKFIMHGIAWNLHKDHHKKDNHFSFFELNDFFFVFFAFLSIIAFVSWSYTNSIVALGIAIGICIYGFVYFFVHDLFIHQRIKVLSQTNNKYLLSIRRAHKIHHKNREKHGGECFGMLWVPLKYFKTKR